MWVCYVHHLLSFQQHLWPDLEEKLTTALASLEPELRKAADIAGLPCIPLSLEEVCWLAYALKKSMTPALFLYLHASICLLCEHAYVSVGLVMVKSLYLEKGTEFSFICFGISILQRTEPLLKNKFYKLLIIAKQIFDVK